MKRFYLGLALGLLFAAGGSLWATLTRTDFVAGEVISASDVNEQLDDAFEAVNNMYPITVMSSGTETVPDGATRCEVTLVGGGGGGGKGGTDASHKGGGAGGSGAVIRSVFAVTAGGTISITIGTAGSSGGSNAACNTLVSPAQAGNGGDTIVTYGGITLTAGGGEGGYSSTYPAGCVHGIGGVGGLAIVNPLATSAIAHDGAKGRDARTVGATPYAGAGSTARGAGGEGGVGGGSNSVAGNAGIVLLRYY